MSNPSKLADNIRKSSGYEIMIIPKWKSWNQIYSSNHYTKGFTLMYKEFGI